MPVDGAHGSGREESQRFAVADLAHRLTDAVDRDLTFLGIVALKGIHCYEVGAHGGDLVQDHVDHDPEFRAA